LFYDVYTEMQVYISEDEVIHQRVAHVLPENSASCIATLSFGSSEQQEFTSENEEGSDICFQRIFVKNFYT
jgi:hypothetical protein